MSLLTDDEIPSIKGQRLDYIVESGTVCGLSVSSDSYVHGSGDYRNFSVSTTVVRTTTFFLRDEAGQEKPYEFTGDVVAMREGHRVSAIWVMGKVWALAALVNQGTGKWQWRGGSDSVLSKAGLYHSPEAVCEAMFALSALPTICTIFYFVYIYLGDMFLLIKLFVAGLGGITAGLVVGYSVGYTFYAIQFLRMRASTKRMKSFVELLVNRSS